MTNRAFFYLGAFSAFLFMAVSAAFAQYELGPSQGGSTSGRTSTSGSASKKKPDWAPRDISGRWHVLLFSVNEVDGMAPLAGCYNDMVYAKERWLDAKENIDLVFLNDVNPESDERLSIRANFDRELDRLLAESLPDDVLLVMVATHGVAYGNKSFVCPKDTLSTEFTADAKEPAAVLDEGENNRLISVTRLLEKLRKSRSAATFLVLDACRSDETGSDGDFLQEFQDTLRRRNTGSLAVMTSCGLHQRAFESKSIDADGEETTYGVFMRHLIDGLTGKADFSGALDGKITLIEAYNYANFQTRRQFPAQTPELYEAMRKSPSASGSSRAAAEFDSLSPTNRTVLGTYHEIPKGENESNLQFAVRTGLELAKASSSTDDYSVVERLFSYVLTNQPHNKMAYGVRGYAQRSMKKYSESLDDLIKSDGCLELFTRAIHPPKETGAYAYETPESENPRTVKADWKNPKTGRTEKIDAKLTFPTGSKVVIDKISGDRLHVALWNGTKPEYDSWIEKSAAYWDPVEAQTVINATPGSALRRASPERGTVAEVRSFGHSAVGGSRVDVAPPMPGLR